MDPAPSPPVQPDEQSPGLLESIRRMVASALGLVETRVELISSEIAEARSRVIRVAIVIGAALVCIQVGALLILVGLVLAIPEANRALAIAIAGLVLILAALAGVLWIRSQTRRPFFATTIAEFQKDRDRLKGKK